MLASSSVTMDWVKRIDWVFFRERERLCFMLESLLDSSIPERLWETDEFICFHMNVLMNLLIFFFPACGSDKAMIVDETSSADAKQRS